MTDDSSSFQAAPPDAPVVKRVVIVDDSRSIRLWLRNILKQDSRLCVVGEASDAVQARQVIKETQPDVLTLDIEMPGMSGLDFLARLMALRPMPVVMVSGTTPRGSAAAIRALSLGAVDCIVKPMSASNPATCHDIARRVFSAACSRTHSAPPRPSVVRASPQYANGIAEPIVLIGASTGGVTALATVLADMAPDGPPVLVVQHMPANFLISFSQMLDRTLPQDVRLADNQTPLGRGQVRLAPALGQQTELTRRNNIWQAQLRPNTERALHCPSVDSLFSSAAPFGHDVIAVILTGLGRDGSEGMKLLHRSGALTIGQDAASSVVYGMPKAAWELGAIDHQLPLTAIGHAVNTAVLNHSARARRSLS
tara:strand:- start:29146 stop:30246 length:1101 start_codon:yes stop_codon:yes gene_type:complete